MTHDAETETAAAVIEDLLYLIPAHWRRPKKCRRRLGHTCKRYGRVGCCPDCCPALPAPT